MGNNVPKCVGCESAASGNAPPSQPEPEVKVVPLTNQQDLAALQGSDSPRASPSTMSRTSSFGSDMEFHDVAETEVQMPAKKWLDQRNTPNLPTNIVDFKG